MRLHSRLPQQCSSYKHIPQRTVLFSLGHGSWWITVTCKEMCGKVMPASMGHQRAGNSQNSIHSRSLPPPRKGICHESSLISGRYPLLRTCRVGSARSLVLCFQHCGFLQTAGYSKPRLAQLLL